jgi:diguanylate cyclase (GGDEF)-like protein
MNDSAPGSILIVDDEKFNLVLLHQILSPDYTIYVAKSGPEALALVNENLPDLILLDIVMPGMDGFEVLKTLRDNPDAQDIPVIFITGLDNDDDEEKGLRMGAVDYITKPLKEAIIRVRVRNHMRLITQMHIIEHLGLIDALTGIANRRSFDTHMVREWRSALRKQTALSILMMDVDKFKAYNDTYGHPQGDVLLKTLATLFQSAARRPRDLAARVGGEEFVILCPDTDHAGALDIAEQLRSNVAATTIFTFDHTPTTITISIGVTTITPSETDLPQNFIELADKRLYIAKKSGRNQVVGENA